MKIDIDSHSFSYIEVYKCNYELSRNNSGPAVCRDCRKPIAAGLGIHRQAYKRNGYLCFACFAKDITILTTRFDGGDAGFFVTSWGKLQACYLNSPTISSAEVIAAVYNAMRDEAYTSIDILLGEEGASVWEIEDTAETLVGS